MLRLLADKYEMPDRFIYLDGDVLVNNDLASLYDYPLKTETELGGVKDAFRLNKGYFNAGVLLFNFKRCLETGLFEKARNLVVKKKMLYVDQEALNKVVKYKEMLPLKFNAKDKYFKEIVCHHFCNVRKTFNIFHRIKPWEVDLVKQKMSAYNDILDDYLSRKSDIERIKNS